MRWIVLLAGISGPATAVGLLLGGRQGSFIALAFVSLILICALLRAERIIAGVHELNPGRKKGTSGIRVIIFRDPTPSAFVVRSLFGRGTILVSQGLVALLDDQELRKVVEGAGLRLRSPAIVLQSVCAVFAVWVSKIVPYSWSGLALGSARRPIRDSDVQSYSSLSALHFLVVFPMIRFFLWLGGTKRHQRNLMGLEVDASRKLAQARQIWESPTHPGISALSIV